MGGKGWARSLFFRWLKSPRSHCVNCKILGVFLWILLTTKGKCKLHRLHFPFDYDLVCLPILDFGCFSFFSFWICCLSDLNQKRKGKVIIFPYWMSNILMFLSGPVNFRYMIFCCQCCRYQSLNLGSWYSVASAAATKAWTAAPSGSPNGLASGSTVPKLKMIISPCFLDLMYILNFVAWTTTCSPPDLRRPEVPSRPLMLFNFVASTLVILYN